MNNPAEGYDLSINNSSLSKKAVEPGEDTVKASVTVTNNGENVDNVYAQVIIEGPTDYIFVSDKVFLGSINIGNTASFNNFVAWDVPASLDDGGYSVKIEVSNDIGDISPSNNIQQHAVSVGDVPVYTSEMIAGFGMFIDIDDNNTSNSVANAAEFSASLTGEIFGWFNYQTISGDNYKIALADLFNQEDGFGMVVKKNNRIMISELGFDADFEYLKPHWIDNDLAIIVEASFDEDGRWEEDNFILYIVEPVTGVGVEPRTKSTVPGILLDYFA